MASKAIKCPLFRVSRGYASAATAACPKPVNKTLSNRALGVVHETNLAVPRITVAFKAGARYEPVSEPGLTHVLRSCAGLSTGRASAFLIQRKLSQIGATLSASTDREFLYYTVEVVHGNLDEAIQVVSEAVSCQEFRPWELTDNSPRLKYDLATIPPTVRAVDLLHKAAYRTGLGNSLFMPAARVGRVSSESLQHYYANYVTAERAAIVVVGSSMGTVDLVANNLSLPTGGQAQASGGKYYGGELREDGHGDLSHVAVAMEGAKAGTPEAYAFAVAARVLGAGPSVKWGRDHSLLARAAGNVGPCAAAGFSAAYSDSGLFGFLLTAHKDAVYQTTKCLVEALRGANITPDMVKAAKNQLTLAVLTEAEDGTQLAESTAAQALTGGAARSPLEVAAAVAAVPEADVIRLASSFGKAKLSMGATGNVSNVPYTDDL